MWSEDELAAELPGKRGAMRGYPGDEWTYVCHQFAFSKQSVKLAQGIWAVTTAPDGWDNATGERIPGYCPEVHGPNRAKCNVIVTHTHMAQQGYSPDDNYDCIGMGCMREQRRTKYTQARATKFNKWNNAFVMYRNGHFTPLTMKFTDWRTVLGDDFYRILMDPQAVARGFADLPE